MKNLPQVKMKNPASENPFYGKLQLFKFYNAAQSGEMSDSLLSSTWSEVKTDKQLTELFWIIAFSCGDIANREHNAMRGVKLDNGGNANREAFQTILNWTRTNHPYQYRTFLMNDVIRQYTSLDNILATRVKTQPGSAKVVKNVNFLTNVDIDMVAEYLAKLIQKGNPMDCQLVAKFLSNVRTSKRQKQDRKTGEKQAGGRNLSNAVKENMKVRQQLYLALSDKMGWNVKVNEKFTEFIGLRDWKAKHNENLESVLFSTKKILTFDKIQFKNFLNELPSGARFRTRRRLLTKDNGSKTTKWANLPFWFLEWEKEKEQLQAQQREIVEKVRLGTATDDEKIALKDIKKEAKVNVGGSSLFTLLEQILSKSVVDDTLAQSILDKIQFDVPVLPIVDCSGSMNEVHRTGGKFKPFDLARLFSTITMTKNPSNELDNLLVCFGSNCEIYTDGSTGTAKQNRFMTGTSVVVDKLVDRTLAFSKNFNSIGKFINAEMGGTHFNSVAQRIKKWVNSDNDTKQIKIEQLQQYPVFVVISDGDMNSSTNPAQSMMDFRREMLEFGWDGVVVIWDVNTGVPAPSKFASVPNTIHVTGWNLGVVNQIFTKITDMDIIDTYLPLKTIYESNRYEMVRKNVI